MAFMRLTLETGAICYVRRSRITCFYPSRTNSSVTIVELGNPAEDSGIAVKETPETLLELFCQGDGPSSDSTL